MQQTAIQVINSSTHSQANPIHIPYEKLRNFDKNVGLSLRYEGNVVPFQLDKTDPAEELSESIVFSLPKDIEPNQSATVTLSEASQSTEQEFTELSDAQIFLDSIIGPEGRARGIRFVNNRLCVWFQLMPALNYEHRNENFYAGSATSVLFKDREILDEFNNDWQHHDLQKRCMQVDKVCVGDEEFSLFNRPYELISQSVGPIRARATVASSSFVINNKNCKLYRVISLYADSDHIEEELYLKEDGQKNGCDFSVTYFSCANLGWHGKIFAGNEKKWRGFGSFEPPYPGYGIASNVRVEAQQEDRDKEEGYSRIHWNFEQTNSLKVLHMFMKCEDFKNFTDLLGNSWYELIDKPLHTT